MSDASEKVATDDEPVHKLNESNTEEGGKFCPQLART